MAGDDRLILPSDIEESLQTMESQSGAEVQAAHSIRTSIQETHERLSKSSMGLDTFDDSFWIYMRGYIEGVKSGIETENKVAFYERMEGMINGI